MDLLETVLDVTFVILLGAVLVYAVRLNKHIRVLQDSKDELRELLGQFVSSTTQAEEALQRIKSRSRDATLSIDEAITEAKNLKIDLMELIRRAESVAGPVGVAAAKAERGQATYRPGYSNGPAKAPVKAKKVRSKKAAPKSPGAKAAPSKPMPQSPNMDMDTEIDPDLEARLAKLIESVESGDPDIAAQSDMFSSGASDDILGSDTTEQMDLSSEEREQEKLPSAEESKAKSKEDLLKALRGMQ
ncbi:MAG: DUF6468 domain-containing protein [Alphaproteobacteria bacterium]|nr:DUF6468 domain-containing protein [Alphaproteobacteria bacterium]